MARPRVKRVRRDAAAAPQSAAQPAPLKTQLMDLHDGVLQQIVKRLGVDRRTVMMGELFAAPLLVSQQLQALCMEAWF